MLNINKLYEHQKLDGDLYSDIRLTEEQDKREEEIYEKIREVLGIEFVDKLFCMEIEKRNAYEARAYKQGFKDSFQISQEVYQ